MVLRREPQRQAVGFRVTRVWGREKNILFGVRTTTVILAVSLGQGTLTSILAIWVCGVDSSLNSGMEKPCKLRHVS